MTASLAGERILVTGASGFIGRHACRALEACGARVIALTRRPSSSDIPVAEALVVDLADASAVQIAIRKAEPTAVVHLAASRNNGVAIAAYRSSYNANLCAALNLAEAIIDGDECRRFVYLSSSEEYGAAPVPFNAAFREAPLTPYGLSKLAVTQLLQALAATHDLPLAVLRPTVVYGPGQGAHMFVSALVRALVAGERFSMTAGEQTRDYIYIDDVVDGILRALTAQSIRPEALNLGSGTPIRLRDLATSVARLVGPRAESLIDFGSIAYRSGEAMGYWADNTGSAAVLGWKPRVPLEEGLRRTIAHQRSSPEVL